jgi:acyl-coenzyme A synthetase/AMP-(fatty) acid ligase
MTARRARLPPWNPVVKNWFDHILFHTRAQPETPAMAMEDRAVTYGMLKDGIARCARRIADINLDREEPVAVLIRNPIRHLTVCLALFRLGIQAVSLEHKQTGIRGRKFSVVLGDREAAGAVDADKRLVEVADEWFAVDLPGSEVVGTGFTDPAQVCRVSFTSGSTGTPKTVEHSVADFGVGIVRFIDVNWERVLCLPGLSSSFGFKTCCAALATGRTVCFAESPYQAMRMVELFAIDFVVASTEQLLALTRVARKTGAEPRSLRTIWFGGSVPTRTLLEAALTHLCTNILCRYSATETGLVAQATAREILSRPGLVGRIVPGVEVGIFAADGRRCAEGETGRVKIRSSTGSAAPRASDAGEHWIDLDDLGRVDSEGRLYLLGRASEASGAELSPVYEIEHILRLEWDVIDAAAVLVDEAPAGKNPQIWIGVVGNEGASAEQLAAILRPRGLQYPLTLFDLPTIPRGSNSKVNRYQLKALMIDAVVKATSVLTAASALER